MKYPIEKYRFIQTGNKTIAISTYAGKTVRGVAKCDPRDTADAEIGKTIAALRCAQKVSQRRTKRAKKKAAEAWKTLVQAKRRYEAMERYLTDSTNAQLAIDSELHNILK